ncbi:hypothetical protein A9798_15390 [Edwardsiella hoshinae]|uniref:K88 pilin n=2 Tax=Edwardsiella hoshinae TaxID=93378 RepID=A0ABM6EMC7_9GAMM|nr:hypothetical protein A9798_15390 [Edwardsiella hoshinae]
MFVAMSVAGVANAAAPTWEDGTTQFNKTFTASGTVVGKEFMNDWEWAVGTGLQGLQGALSQATTTNGNKVTITVPTLTPILVGKTKKAIQSPFPATDNLGVGSTPHIAFTSDGQPVKLTGEGEVGEAKGKAYLDIAVKANNVKIGTARLHLTYVGVAGEVDLNNNDSIMYSLFAAEQNAIFLGGLPINVGSSEFRSGSKAVAMTAKFGGLSKQDLLKQLGIQQFTTITENSSNYEYLVAGAKVAATYALGFQPNQTIDVTFEQGRVPTSTTPWTASLGIQVTYV